MTPWLSKVLHPVSGDTQLEESVHHTLEGAQKSRAKISFDISHCAGTIYAVGSIVLLNDNDFVVTRPVSEGKEQPLTAHEHVKFGFVYKSNYYVGESEILGPVDIASGDRDGGASAGYRLSMPESLHVADRRQHPRFHVEHELMLDGQLILEDSDSPIDGEIVDLSLTGALFRAADSLTNLSTGTEVTLTTTLPDQGGDISIRVMVARVQIEPRTKHQVFGLKFLDEVPGLPEVIESIRWVRMTQRRAG